MRILFLHQNFPGQFLNLAPELVRLGHKVLALKLQDTPVEEWKGVTIVGYLARRSSTAAIHPWLADFEAKVIRAEAVFETLRILRDKGFMPDLVIAHPGWGESMFVKEVWPYTKLAIYCEFFYQSTGADVGFDPEFFEDEASNVCNIQLKNLNNEKHFTIADAGIAPTHWQASTFPPSFRNKISVIHDGIDTELITPKLNVTLHLQENSGMKVLTKNDEVITFVNRNLEPYRGYHVFMRALPAILRLRPSATILIVGGDEISYGKSHPSGGSWKHILLDEIGSQLSQQELARVKFLGSIPYDHFISVLQLSRLHIYLTYPFVLSWSLLEAMSAGCSIIASDTAPLREVIIHNETGRLVDFFDCMNLAKEVDRLLDDPTERTKLGMNARAFAQKHYDLNTVCLPKQIQWINSLMGV